MKGKTNEIIDLSGFMFSGKAAASDLLKEFSGFYVPYYRTEFDLLRIGGGLIDLKNSVNDWSPIRSYSALCRFIEVINKLASVPKFPEKLFKTGFGYNKIYPNLLLELNNFVDEITEVTWETTWPYEDLYDGPIATFFRKTEQKFSRNKKRKYILVSKEKFLSAAQEFVKNILWENVDLDRYEYLVVHNALEPFNPQKNIDLLGNNAKCIVVDRDPRDIYVTAITKQVGFNDNLDLYKRIAGAHDIDIFIDRYNVYHKNLKRDENSVLRINFEDLVLEYEGTINKIYNFLNIEPDIHINKRKYFKPEESKRNIGLWKDPILDIYKDDFVKINELCNG